MEFNIIPNYVDTLLINEGMAQKGLNLHYDEFGECEIEFEFYDGVAYPTDGSELVLKYPTIKVVRNSKRMQNEITSYNGIDDEINQYDIALKYGKLSKNNVGYVKMSKKRHGMLGETIVMLAADLYQKLYDMSEVLDYTSTAAIIRDAAEEFERELDWDMNGNDDRDYIMELEKFEERKLKEWEEFYG